MVGVVEKMEMYVVLAEQNYGSKHMRQKRRLQGMISKELRTLELETRTVLLTPVTLISTKTLPYNPNPIPNPTPNPKSTDDDDIPFAVLLGAFR